jgi:Zn finger protein HypA/HybF involved in hydrogenase expression
MHESMISRETWTYECRSCLHEWQEVFQAGRFSDGHGGEVIIYSRLGHRCTSPWAELFCPSCGGCDVKILPTGWTEGSPLPRRRHAELEMLFHLRRLHAY